MTPSVLYKYVVPERMDVLLRRKIRFTQPCFLNDPFEFLIGEPEDAGHFEASRDKKRQSEIRAKSRVYGVLSLTEMSKSIPMWTFYAASHRGFAIGFDARSGYFKVATDNGTLQRVNYGPNRVSSTRGLPDQPWVKHEASFLRKSTVWEYEAEWRWIEPGGPGVYDEVGSAPNGELLYLRSIPPESIQEVILGCRASSELAESIQALRSAPEYRHLKVFKVALHKSRYDLEIEGA